MRKILTGVLFLVVVADAFADKQQRATIDIDVPDLVAKFDKARKTKVNKTIIGPLEVTGKVGIKVAGDYRSATNATAGMPTGSVDLIPEFGEDRIEVNCIFYKSTRDTAKIMSRLKPGNIVKVSGERASITFLAKALAPLVKSMGLKSHTGSTSVSLLDCKSIVRLWDRWDNQEDLEDALLNESYDGLVMLSEYRRAAEKAAEKESDSRRQPEWYSGRTREAFKTKAVIEDVSVLRERAFNQARECIKIKKALDILRKDRPGQLLYKLMRCTRSLHQNAKQLNKRMKPTCLFIEEEKSTGFPAGERHDVEVLGRRGVCSPRGGRRGTATGGRSASISFMVTASKKHPLLYFPADLLPDGTKRRNSEG